MRGDALAPDGKDCEVGRPQGLASDGKNTGCQHEDNAHDEQSSGVHQNGMSSSAGGGGSGLTAPGFGERTRMPPTILPPNEMVGSS